MKSRGQQREIHEVEKERWRSFLTVKLALEEGMARRGFGSQNARDTKPHLS